jgi:hypothetical protein
MPSTVVVFWWSWKLPVVVWEVATCFFQPERPIILSERTFEKSRQWANISKTVIKGKIADRAILKEDDAS